MATALNPTGPAAGERLPDLVRTIELADMVAYGGATWDWHRLHYDQAYVAARGLAAPVVDGQMLGALLAEQALDWAGPRAFVRRLRFRLRSMVAAGETVRCEAVVAGLSGEDGLLVIRLDQRVLVGERLVADGGAEVTRPS
ncbi:MAG: MaoC family dehydratase [Acidimicrobiales bacterium]